MNMIHNSINAMRYIISTLQAAIKYRADNAHALSPEENVALIYNKKRILGVLCVAGMLAFIAAGIVTGGMGFVVGGSVAAGILVGSIARNRSLNQEISHLNEQQKEASVQSAIEDDFSVLTPEHDGCDAASQPGTELVLIKDMKVAQPFEERRRLAELTHLEELRRLAPPVVTVTQNPSDSGSESDPDDPSTPGTVPMARPKSSLLTVSATPTPRSGLSSDRPSRQ